MTVSRGGGGDCKGISRQTVVPSTDASKENTCEATFALMPMCFIQHKVTAVLYYMVFSD